MLDTPRSRSSRYLLLGILSRGRQIRFVNPRLSFGIDGTISPGCQGIELAGNRRMCASAGIEGKRSWVAAPAGRIIDTFLTLPDPAFDRGLSLTATLAAVMAVHRSAPAQCLQCQALLMKMGRWVSGSLQRGQCWYLGALGMMISCGAGCVETAMTPLGAGPTPGPEVGSPISNCAISLEQRFLEGGIRTAPTP